MVNRQRVDSVAFGDQKPGTSGLRKPTSHFFQPNYVENFVQAILTSEGDDLKGTTLVLGGDGRYGTKPAIKTIISLAAANGVGKLLIGQNGILSTPAVSCIIRKYGALGGILLTASHNPGGVDGDFGIKYNGKNGGPAPDKTTDRIFELSKTIDHFWTAPEVNVNIDQIGQYKFEVEGQPFVVEVVDSVNDYLELMKEIFDFGAIRAFLKNFQILINCMNGVTGPYATRIFLEELCCPAESVINNVPLEDFGGIHPDPNLTYAADMLELMRKNETIGFGVAYDGDGDRNMILGREGFFVNPSDSLAVLFAYIKNVKWFKGVKGVARSMPTSMAVDRVAEVLGFKCYEVPTGWKYFGNLMDAGKISLCGEESFGTGSTHIREKDGIWTSLLWLSLLSSQGTDVETTLRSHWVQFGRNYYGRHDYEGVDTEKANVVMATISNQLEDKKRLEEVTGKEVTVADNFSYADPVDGSVTTKQGLRIVFSDGSRLVWRLSGTGSQGATVRLYLEAYRNDELNLDSATALKDIHAIALRMSNIHETLNVKGPTVVT